MSIDKFWIFLLLTVNMIMLQCSTAEEVHVVPLKKEVPTVSMGSHTPSKKGVHHRWKPPMVIDHRDNVNGEGRVHSQLTASSHDQQNHPKGHHQYSDFRSLHTIKKNHVYLQLLEDDEGNATDTIAPEGGHVNITLEDDPDRALSIENMAVLAMSSAAGLISLGSAIVNPALCSQSARIYLILQLSRCAFQSLENIEVVFYPVQVGFGNDPANRFFAALVLVWPFGGVIVTLHFLLVKQLAGGDADKLEMMKRKYHFPSLSITALVLFFWQPMSMSAVTVLSRGKDQWLRSICFIGLLAALAVSSFAVRWYWREAVLGAEYIDAADYEERLREMRDAQENPKKEEDQEGEKEKKEEGDAEDDVKLSLAEIRKRAKEKRDQERSEVLGETKIDLEAEEADRRKKEAENQKKNRRVYYPLSSIECSEQTTMFQKWFTSSGTWVDKFKSREGQFHGFVDKFGYMFFKFRPGRQWFLAVEVLVSSFLGVIEGVRPINRTGCWALSCAQLIMLALHFIALVALHPYLTRFDNVSFAALSLVQLLSVVFMVIDVRKSLLYNLVASNVTGVGVNETGTLATTVSDLSQFGLGGVTGNGTFSAAQDTDVRKAADFTAFVCFSICVVKGLADVILMYYFWKQHNRDPAEELEAKKKQLKAAANKKPVGKKGNKNNGDDDEPRHNILDRPLLNDIPVPYDDARDSGEEMSPISRRGRSAASASPLAKKGSGGGGGSSPSPKKGGRKKAFLSSGDSKIDVDF